MRRWVREHKAAEANKAERLRQRAVKDAGFSLRIDVELNGRTYERDLALEARVELDPEGLSQALADQPGQFAFYSAAEVEARALAKEAELVRAKKHAELFLFYESSQARTDADGRRAKPTVEAIKSLIAKNPEYLEAQRGLILAERKLDYMVMGRQTMQHKKDVQLAIASNYRAELDAHVGDTMRALRERFATAQERKRGGQAADNTQPGRSR